MVTAGMKVSGTGTVFTGVQPGDIVLVNNRNGNLLSKLIRWVTGSVWSHTAVGFFPLRVLPDLTISQIFEANLSVCATSWVALVNDKQMDIRVYRIKQLDPVTAQDFLAKLYVVHNNTTYGFFQLFFFLWRRLVELLRVPRRWALHNPFTGNRICTGVIYDFLDEVRNWAERTATYEDKMGNSYQSPFYRDRHDLAVLLQGLMDTYHPQTVNPKDIEGWMDVLVTHGLAEVQFDRRG